jgi:lipid-binding SYLF domain-containing protein
MTALLVSAKNPAERVQSAQAVLDEVMNSEKDTIPRDLLEKAHCIVIVPSLKRGAFIVGAQYGQGVALCRKSTGVGWSGPSIIKMEGGSLGLQIGGGETDVILVVNNKQGADKLMRSEFTLGGEGAVMAGPVGRAASAETDAYMRAEILSYSRSRGVFAGIAIKGSTLRSDDSENRELYGKPVTHAEILKGTVAAPPAAAGLIRSLNRYSRIESGSLHPARR